MPHIIKQDATDPIAPDINPEQFAQVGTRYRTFLLTRGMDAERALQQGDLVDGFVREQLPSGVATQAINQLRQLARGRRPRGGAIEAAAPYPGRHACAQTAVEYLASHYGEAIQDGRLTPGQLSRIDKRLYAAVDASRGGPVGVCFARIRSDQRRADGRAHQHMSACADILGQPEAQAAEFFSRMRRSEIGPSRASAEQIAARYFQDACALYETFLISQNLSPKEAEIRSMDFALFAAQQLPDLGTLAAARELREFATLWNGTAQRPEALDELSPALRYAYAQREAGQSLTFVRNRDEACAAILGTTALEASLYFASARASASTRSSAAAR